MTRAGDPETSLFKHASCSAPPASCMIRVCFVSGREEKTYSQTPCLCKLSRPPKCLHFVDVLQKEGCYKAHFSWAWRELVSASGWNSRGI